MEQRQAVDDRKVVSAYEASIEFHHVPTDVAASTWARGRRSRARRRVSLAAAVVAVVAVSGYPIYGALGSRDSSDPPTTGEPSAMASHGVNRDDCAGGVSSIHRYASGDDGFATPILAVQAETGDKVDLVSYDGADGMVMIDLVTPSGMVSATYTLERLDAGWTVLSVQTCLT